jgi:hypothetical protein
MDRPDFKKRWRGPEISFSIIRFDPQPEIGKK